MRLKAGCQMQLSATGPAPLVAMLRPRSGEAQWIVGQQYDFEPFVRAVEYEDAFGNLCQRFTIPVGKFTLRTEVIAEVEEAIAVEPSGALTLAAQLPDYTLQFLLPSRYCPSDTLGSFAAEITQGKVPGYEQVDAITRWIKANITYKYGVSNASTTATDTLRDRAGVCRDYTHIGLSLCRALSIPARMVVGYLYKLDPMDLHAWFEAFIAGRWYIFDATQSEPRGGRIAIAYGRDAADVALITNLSPLKSDNLKVWVERLG